MLPRGLRLQRPQGRQAGLGTLGYAAEEIYGDVPPAAFKPYKQVENYAKRAPLGAYCITSAVDGLWLQLGWPQSALLELHGKKGFLMCSNCNRKPWPGPSYLGPEIPDPPTEEAGDELDLERWRAQGMLPECPDCGSTARPFVRLLGEDPLFEEVVKETKEKQKRVLQNWTTELKERPHSERLRVLCLELGCGLAAPEVRSELQEVMQQFPLAKYIRINPEEDVIFPNMQELHERCVSVSHGVDEAFAAMHSQIRPKAMELCRFIVKDRALVARDVLAPQYASPMRLLHILERAGVRMEYEISESSSSKTLDPEVIVFMPSDTPERRARRGERFEGIVAVEDMIQEQFEGIATWRILCRPSLALRARRNWSRALAAFQLLHVRFKAPPGHSPLVQEGITWLASEALSSSHVRISGLLPWRKLPAKPPAKPKPKVKAPKPKLAKPKAAKPPPKAPKEVKVSPSPKAVKPAPKPKAPKATAKPVAKPPAKRPAPEEAVGRPAKRPTSPSDEREADRPDKEMAAVEVVEVQDDEDRRPHGRPRIEALALREKIAQEIMPRGRRS
ncbi:unnamed protein product [Effrenium voratum]|nr:unnamed protein product [Effrenium voratum]